MSEVRPFYQRPWRGEKRAAAQAFWDWHLALHAAATGAPNHLPHARKQAEAHSRKHRLDLTLFDQAEAQAPRWSAPMRFETAHDLAAFTDDWAGPLARLLATLAGVPLRFHSADLATYTRALFWTARLAHLPEDARADRLFLPAEDLAHYDAAPDAVRSGTVTPGVRKVIWRHTVRCRDALAHAMPLAGALPRRHRTVFKETWFGALELLSAIERADGDVWTQPVGLHAGQKARVWWQARFGKTTFK